MATRSQINDIPQWLLDAVVGLVASAYEAGQRDAAEKRPAPLSAVSTATMLSRAEAAEELHVSVAMVDKLMRSGRLAKSKIGARSLITRESLETYRAGVAA